MFEYSSLVDNSQQHHNDFMNIINMAANAEDEEGRSFYTPGYGGYGTSELRHNMYQNFLTNYTNYQIQQKVNDTNLQLAKDENRFNEYMWNLNNQYNSPEQQAQRFRDAGMSQAAAVQATQGFPSQQVQSANLANQQIGNAMQAAPYGSPFSALMGVLNFAGSMLNLHRGMEALRMDRVNAEKAERTMNADIDSVVTRADAQHWALRQQIQDYQYESQTFPYRVSTQKYIAAKAEKDNTYQELANNYMDEQVKLARQQFSFLEKKNDKEIDEMQSVIDRNIAEKNKAEQEERESKAREGVANAQSGYYGAMTSNVNEDTNLKKQQTEGEKRKNYAQEVENALKTFGYPEDFTGKMSALVESGVISAKEVGSFLKHDKQFIETAGNMFEGNDNERSALNNFLLPGRAKDNLIPVWSHGTYHQTRRKIKSAAKKTFDYLSNPPIEHPFDYLNYR